MVRDDDMIDEVVDDKGDCERWLIVKLVFISQFTISFTISLTISSHLASSLHISYGGGGDEREGRDCERGG